MRQTLTDLRGTPAFADALADRERALGLVKTEPMPNATAAMPDAAVADATPASDIGASVDALADSFGNRILDTPARLGQYRIVSARDGRILRVCGEAASDRHLPFWDYDAGEQRMVCRLCWPTVTRMTTASAMSTAMSTGEVRDDDDL